VISDIGLRLMSEPLISDWREWSLTLYRSLLLFVIRHPVVVSPPPHALLAWCGQLTLLHSWPLYTLTWPSYSKLTLCIYRCVFRNKLVLYYPLFLDNRVHPFAIK
jgi:hypothetical protein